MHASVYIVITNPLADLMGPSSVRVCIIYYHCNEILGFNSHYPRSCSMLRHETRRIRMLKIVL